MASHSLSFWSLFLLLLAIQTASSRALLSSLDLKEAILKGLEFQDEDLKISGFDVKDALVGVGHSVAYEFDNKV
jgi:hypothetical protein